MILVISTECVSCKTHEEYLKDYLSPSAAKVSEGILHKPAFNVTYPYSLDWRMKGFVTEVYYNEKLTLYLMLTLITDKGPRNM